MATGQTGIEQLPQELRPTIWNISIDITTAQERGQKQKAHHRLLEQTLTILENLKHRPQRSWLMLNTLKQQARTLAHYQK